MTARTGLFQRLLGLTDRLRPASAPSAALNTTILLERLQADFESKVDALVAGMKAGTITPGQFVGAMPSLIKQQQLAAAVIGEGGPEHATPQTHALAQRAVDQQLAYFERWKSDLLKQAADGQLPSAEYIANRAKLYGKAATATASEAGTQARGMPTLPFYPGQQTQCLVNCKCAWDIKVLDVVNANFDCYWRLAPAEHCPTCAARARVANPLRVRHGAIVDVEQYQEAGLYA